MTMHSPMTSSFYGPYVAVTTHEPDILALAVKGGTVELATNHIESLACSVTAITFQSGPIPLGPSEPIQGATRGGAVRWVQEVNRVLHTLELLELDQESQTFVARTSVSALAPQSTRRYFELQGTPQRVVLSRFIAAPHQPRQVTPFVVTQEMLHGLVTAFEHVVDRTAA